MVCQRKYVMPGRDYFEQIFLLLLIVVLIAPLNAQDTEDSQPAGKSFSGLQVLQEGMAEVRFHGDHTKVINKARHQFEKTSPLHDGSYKSNDIVLIKTRFSSDDDWYYVLFSEGPGDEPILYLLAADTSENRRVILSGHEAIIPGNGYIYTRNRFNNTFLKRRKYVFKKGELVEIKQPFYYVGLTSKTVQPLILYDDKTAKNEVARLPADYEVEVLLTDETREGDSKWYLVRTPFGLTGWVKIKIYNLSQDVIEDLRYLGD